MLVPILAGESGLGAAGASDLVLLGSKLLAPLGVGFPDFFRELFGHLFGHVVSPENKMKKER
jgi:hypothetical protein